MGYIGTATHESANTPAVDSGTAEGPGMDAEHIDANGAAAAAAAAAALCHALRAYPTRLRAPSAL